LGGAFALKGLFFWGFCPGGFCPGGLLSVARRKREVVKKEEGKSRGLE